MLTPSRETRKSAKTYSGMDLTGCLQQHTASKHTICKRCVCGRGLSQIDRCPTQKLFKFEKAFSRKAASTQHTVTKMAAAAAFAFPDYYHMPAFFTYGCIRYIISSLLWFRRCFRGVRCGTCLNSCSLAPYRMQPVAATRRKQLAMWVDIIVAYQRQHKSNVIRVNEDAKSPLFYNDKIDRKYHRPGPTFVVHIACC